MLTFLLAKWKVPPYLPTKSKLILIACALFGKLPGKSDELQQY